MLKITTPQIGVLHREIGAVYARDLARYIRVEHGDAVRALSDAELLRRVRIGIARAEGYGMTWDSTITAFVAIMFEIAPTFDEQAAIRRVLHDARIPPDTRVDALWTRTTEENWVEAARRAIDADAFWKSAAGEDATTDATRVSRAAGEHEALRDAAPGQR